MRRNFEDQSNRGRHHLLPRQKLPHSPMDFYLIHSAWYRQDTVDCLRSRCQFGGKRTCRIWCISHALTMSYADPGSGQFHHRPSGSYDFNSATPPPPPPKPGSGTQTPSRGQPPPPLPQGHVAPDPSQYDYSYSSGAQSFQPISPPETGWLPAGLVDKT